MTPSEFWTEYISQSRQQRKSVINVIIMLRTVQSKSGKVKKSNLNNLSPSYELISIFDPADRQRSFTVELDSIS